MNHTVSTRSVQRGAAKARPSVQNPAAAPGAAAPCSILAKLDQEERDELRENLLAWLNATIAEAEYVSAQLADEDSELHEACGAAEAHKLHVALHNVSEHLLNARPPVAPAFLR